MSECDSSDQAVSVVVVVVVVVGVNFFSFSTSSLKPLHGFASNFVWIFLRWTPTKFVKIVVLPLFFMELSVILCNFWPILKKSIFSFDIGTLCRKSIMVCETIMTLCCML